MIWNEANSSRFWSPQRGAAAGYEALLADCWDELHANGSRVNVISSTAPHQAPAGFIAELGRAYRTSGRTKRIFDTFGHNAYPDHNAESPLARHPPGGSIDEGDYGALMSALTRAFVGTGQPVPGSADVTIW